MKVFLVFTLCVTVSAGLRKQYYPVKSRSLSTPEFTLEDFLEEFQLTFSDDSPPKVLNPFFIDVFPTSGILPDDSLSLFETSMDTFLSVELRKIYDARPKIDSVSSGVNGQKIISQSTTRRRYLLSTSESNSIVGTQIETQINVTFQNDPSPSTEVVQEIVARLLGQHMDDFIGNLTNHTSGDGNYGSPLDGTYKEQEDVDSGDAGGSPPPGEEAPGVNKAPAVEEEEDRRNLEIIVPLTVGACALFALIALFTLRRRNERRLLQDDGSFRMDGLGGDVEVFIDDDASDVFSFEAALSPRKSARSGQTPPPYFEDSPTSGSGLSAIEERSASQASYSQASYQESDIFSGLSESPRHAADSSKSVFSIFSGISRGTNADASTVMASNRADTRPAPTVSPLVAEVLGSPGGKNILGTPNSGAGKQGNGTPGSRVSSLFTFSEEGEEEVESTEEAATGVDSPSKPAVERIFPFGPASPQHTEAKTANPKNGDILSPKSDHSIPAPIEVISEDSSVTSQIVGIAATSLTGTPTENGRTSPNKSRKIGLSRMMCAGSPRGRRALTPSFGSKKDSDAEMNTSGYGSDPGPNQSEEGMSPNIRWGSPWNSRKNADEAKQFVAAAQSPTTPTARPSADVSRSGRRHAKSTAGDGTTDYQRETMLMNVTAASFDAVSLSDGSDVAEENTTKGYSSAKKRGIGFPKLDPAQLSDVSAITGPKTPTGAATTPRSMNSSIMSESPRSCDQGSYEDKCVSRKVITDLIWLEKKIASTKNLVGSSNEEKAKDDSLSFSSGENQASPGSTDSTIELGTPKVTAPMTPRTMKSIVCRDCFAPPGKLKIIIHSTKDGPAVHTVKKGSSLEGHIFAGDLIISVDNVDTRSFSAEQVMKMMTAKTRFERRITVLHFEDISNSG